MNEPVFLVKGSAAEPYQVSFVNDGEDLLAFCNCRAGQNGQCCKHRIEILNGTDTGISGDNQADVAQVLTWLEGTKLQSVLTQIGQTQAVFDDSKKKLASLKKSLAKTMRGQRGAI